MLEYGVFIGKECVVVVGKETFLCTQLCRKESLVLCIKSLSMASKKDKCNSKVCSSNMSWRQHAHLQKWPAEHFNQTRCADKVI